MDSSSNYLFVIYYFHLKVINIGKMDLRLFTSMQLDSFNICYFECTCVHYTQKKIKSFFSHCNIQLSTHSRNKIVVMETLKCFCTI